MDPRTARTRQAALRSALDLLLEEGLDAVTHGRVATRADLGRRTLYRHWPTRRELLHDTLAGASFPTGRPTGDLRADVRRHLEQLRDALVDGPLATIVVALAARSATDPEIAALRTRLVEAGCEPLRELLRTHAADGDPTFDVEVRVAELEGPLFYVVCVRGLVPDDALLDDLVDRVLAPGPTPG